MDAPRKNSTCTNRSWRSMLSTASRYRVALPSLIRVSLLACVTLLVTGCAASLETRRSLTGYVQAMDQVEQSADMFLTDFSSGLKVQRELQRVAGTGSALVSAEYPATFTPPGDPRATQTEAEKAVSATRQAVVVVHQYNDALIALAEGRSEEEIRARTTAFGGTLQSLATIAGTALPGLGAFAAIGPKIIKLAQDAVNRKQLEAAVNAGRGPVGEILKILEDQTSDMYRLSVVGTKQGQEKLGDNIQRAALALKPLMERYAPPSAPALIDKMVELQAELGNLGRKTGTLGSMPIPIPFTNTSGKPTYDTPADATTEVFMQAMRTSAGKYEELIAKQNAYYQLMDKYVITLRRTGDALDLVAKSLAMPVDLRAEADRLLKVAFDLRDAMSTYRNPGLTAVAP